MGRAALCLLQVSPKLTCLHLGGPGNHTVRIMFAATWSARFISYITISLHSAPRRASHQLPWDRRGFRPGALLHDEPGLPEPRSSFRG